MRPMAQKGLIKDCGSSRFHPSRVVSFALGFFGRFCRLGPSSKFDQEKYRKYTRLYCIDDTLLQELAFYKDVQARIHQNFKNILRTYPG